MLAKMNMAIELMVINTQDIFTMRIPALPVSW
jgi:hypothetical protein